MDPTNNSELNSPTILQSHDVNSSEASSLVPEGDDDEDDDNQDDGERSRQPKRLKKDKLPARNIVQSDGVQYARQRDAPGQNCVYIIPGDHEKEKYRAGTFGKFPGDTPVLPVPLARGGFYYTGYKDRVKCFSCGIAVENWTIGDDPLDPRWHKGDCLMARNGDPRNIPSSLSSDYVCILATFMHANSIGSSSAGQRRQANATDGEVRMRHRDNVGAVSRQLEQVNLSSQQEMRLANIQDLQHKHLLISLNLKSEMDRRQTFLKWPSYPVPFLSGDLAANGFYYLGNLDRTQCFSCFGVLRNWTQMDDVESEHRRHFPHCNFVLGEYSGNIRMTVGERHDYDVADQLRLAQLLPSKIGDIVEPSGPNEEEKRRLADFFPCQTPMNPHMKLENARLQTFDHRWPREKVRATPEQISKAGFFFLGESDKTKCFYCNGGLQNWDPNDEPWTEHAKWFPGCEFVIRRKGVEFVRRLVEAHPNLNRPTIRNHVSYDIPPGVEYRSAGRVMIDVQAIKGMGFSDDRIQRAIQRKTSKNGVGYTETQELIDDLLNDHDDPNTSAPMQVQSPVSSPGRITACASKRGSSTSAAESAKETRFASYTPQSRGIVSELQILQAANMCKNCHRKKAEFITIPCGHLAACSLCEQDMKRCFICNKKIQSTMKIYRA